MLQVLLIVAFCGGIPFFVGAYGNSIIRKNRGPIINLYFVFQILSSSYTGMMLWSYWKYHDKTLFPAITGYYLVAITVSTLIFWLFEEISKRL